MRLTDVMRNRVLIFDGAMGTMLGKYDPAIHKFPELLNVYNPKLVESIHKRYVQAGADVITTFTIGVQHQKLVRTGHTISDVITAACRNAKRAADGAYVALCIGPTGYSLKAVGERREEVARCFAEIIGIGIREGVDAILFESFSDVQEARIGILVAQEMTELPVFLTYAFLADGRTLTGDTIEQGIAAVEGLGLSAVGFNCSVSPNELHVNFNRIKSLTALPILLQPNAGPSKIVHHKRVYVNNTEKFTEALTVAIRGGASIIGGCCGTTPEYIRRIAKLKKHYMKQSSVKRHQVVSNALRSLTLDKPLLIGDTLDFNGVDVNSNMANHDKVALDNALASTNAASDLLTIRLDGEQDEASTVRLLSKLGTMLPQPLILSSTCEDTLKSMLKGYPGRGIVGATGGIAPEGIKGQLRLAAQYGALAMVMIRDHRDSEAGKLNLMKEADWLISAAKAQGLSEASVIVDVTPCFEHTAVNGLDRLLDAVAELKTKRDILIHLDLKNVADGHINKEAIQSVLFPLALAKGVDLLRACEPIGMLKRQIKGLCLLREDGLDSQENSETTLRKRLAEEEFSSYLAQYDPSEFLT